MPPFFVIQEGKNGQKKYSGVLWDIIEYIQQSRNCKITVVTPTDGGFGDCFKNGTCNGILGMINRSEVDFSLGKENVPGHFLFKKALRSHDLSVFTAMANFYIRIIYGYFQGHIFLLQRKQDPWIFLGELLKAI